MNYRSAIMALVFFKDKLLVVNKNGVGWQFPQGGIDPTEKNIDALIRELDEELSIKRSHIIKIIESKYQRTYDWPPELQKKNKFKGQVQTVFFVFINTPTLKLDGKELVDYQWLKKEDVLLALTFDDLKTFTKIILEELEKIG